ncbi:MAG: sigma-70 family RNA polymerase sigma factor [Eubacteriales bacterium]|nr:sigma-70 family RNA polymerase sigma factor [Eubacteriales bacterium]
MIQLVKKAIQGDVDAFLELMEQNSLAMYKIARGILKNDHDVADAIQDTILKCFEKIHTLRQPEYFKTWMIRVLINECNQILGHYQRINMPGELPETARQDASLAEFEFKEMLELVDEKYRVILILHYVEGFKISEIAELLDLKENTVKTRLLRAREQVRAAYLGGDSKPTSMSAGDNRISRQGGISNEKTDRISGIGKYTAG